jgi:hypothetical protein
VSVLVISQPSPVLSPSDPKLIGMAVNFGLGAGVGRLLVPTIGVGGDLRIKISPPPLNNQKPKAEAASSVIAEPATK